MSLWIIVLTLFLGTFVWRLFRFITRQKSTKSGANNKETKPQTDKTADTLTPICDNSINTADSQLHLSSAVQLVNSERTVKLNQQQSTLQAGVSNLKASINDLQLQLVQERKQRESAEDWAEFLLRELDAHIRACQTAEQKYKQLARKLNLSNPELLAESSSESSSKTFTDIDEVQLIWDKTTTGQENTRHGKSEILRCDIEHDENEWNQIVEANLRILQAKNQQGSLNQITSETSRSQTLFCQSQPSVHVNGKPIHISAGESETPKNETIPNTRAEKIQNNDTSSSVHLTIPSQENKRNQQLNIAEEENLLVCQDSLLDIKETTRLWENLSSSKERLDSTGSISPVSPFLARTPSNTSLQEACNDIKEGLVRENLKIWENSESS